MRNRGIVVVAAIALALAGCTQPQESTNTPSHTTAPTLPAQFVELIDGSTATIPLTKAALMWLRGTDEGLVHNKTEMAYDNLIAGDKDIIFVTAPSVEELAAAAQAGVELEVIPIVKDGLVFLVNESNPVNELTGQQVKDIYTGKITNWSQVKGKNSGIIPYQRQTNSGSQTLFLQLAMGDTVPMDAPERYRITTMNDLVDAISEYDNSDQALGYSMFYYTQEMYVKDNTKALAIDGVTPSNENISTDAYPYGTNYFAVIRADEPEDSLSRELIDWFLSDEGQQLASRAGYVPMDPSNIREMTSEFGYFGSTPENTTQSRGTGGAAGWRPTAVSGACGGYDSCTVDDGKLDLPGFPNTQAAAQSWLDSLPSPLSEFGDGSIGLRTEWTARIVQDLLVVERYTYLAIEWSDPLEFDGAAFRLEDGYRMTLADFFYDDVNYIEFINTNLLSPHNNQAWGQNPGSSVGDLVGSFTGLPADYEIFWAAPMKPKEQVGFDLVFKFPIGNPFLLNTDDLSGLRITSQVLLRLPRDLSPYGELWRIDQIMSGKTQVDHVARDYTGINPIDTVLNGNIDALASANPSAAAIRVAFVSKGEVTVCLDHYGVHCQGEVVYFDYNSGKPI